MLRLPEYDLHSEELLRSCPEALHLYVRSSLAVPAFLWKKLFDKINFNGLSIEQQKGLIGESLFINHLLDHQKSSSTILNGWTGPDFEDKDFVFGATGIEIKLTSSK